MSRTEETCMQASSLPFVSKAEVFTRPADSVSTPAPP